MAETNQTVALPEEISVRSLADLLKVEPTKVIAKLVTGGVMATINQSLDYDTAALLCEEFGFTAELQAKKAVTKTVTPTGKNVRERAPIVTIMGHVDHGKTSLLDYIRQSDVAAGETGGITQHISAYQITFKPKDGTARQITFVDTPGHEAFSALRSHGATLTDVVILVVAADDGVKPQTVEAIEHARLANVPVVVAINKTDLPAANAERVKQQLAEQQLISEEWGGQTTMVSVSAKTGAGVDQLLEMVLLTADLLELKADETAQPEGLVIEANLDKQVGPVATVLVYNGTLRPGQVVVIGQTYGRIRAMDNDRGVRVTQAGPALPVQIFGLKDVPPFGERLVVVPSEKVARSMTQSTAHSRKGTAGEDANTYKVIIKVDVGGSLAAFEDSIGKMAHKDATVELVSSGIGQVTENDLHLAKSAEALVISFRVPVQKRIRELAEKDGLTLREDWIIYDAIEFLQAELKRIATPVVINTEIGRLKVLEVFNRKGTSAIIGGEVTEGEAKTGTNLIIYRDKTELGQATVEGLKLGKIEANRVEKGQQCGVGIIDESVAIEKGDVVAFVETRTE